MAQTPTNPPQTATLTIDVEPDDHPDLSHLGTWTDDPGPDDRTVDRIERGIYGRHEARYFVAAMSADETGNPDSVEQDWKRMETYGRTWHMIGIRATVTVEVDGTKQTFKSRGLWGIESDAGDDYLEEIAREELADLKTTLDAFSVDYPDDPVDITFDANCQATLRFADE